MESYKIHKVIGDGSFGTVYKATNIKTGEIVAIKKIKKKFPSWDECMSLRELKSLRKLIHPNIIKLKEVIKVKDELHFVFEFLDMNIFQMYNNTRESGKTFSENQVRSIVYQTALGLAHMHKHGFFHRDLKPENLLMHKDSVKIADFGLAREIRSRPPYTDYVATRWYRAPEILLKSTNYNSPVDIFALGCIMAELYTFSPLFRGTSEADQLYKVCSILGTPTQSSWSEGFRLASQMAFTFPQFNPVPLETIIPNASEEAIQLISEMIKYDAHKRPSAQQVLQHPYFMNYVHIERPITPQMIENSPTVDSKIKALSRDASPVKQTKGAIDLLNKNNDFAGYSLDVSQVQRLGMSAEANRSPTLERYQTNERNQRDSPYLSTKRLEPKGFDKKIGQDKSMLATEELIDDLTNSKDKHEELFSAQLLEDEINQALEGLKTDVGVKQDLGMKRNQAKYNSNTFSGSPVINSNDSGLMIQTKKFPTIVNNGGGKSQTAHKNEVNLYDPWDDKNAEKNPPNLLQSPYDFLPKAGNNINGLKPSRASPLTLPGNESGMPLQVNNGVNSNNPYTFSAGLNHQGQSAINGGKGVQNNFSRNNYPNSVGLKIPGASVLNNPGSRSPDVNMHLGGGFDFEAALQEEVGGLGRYKF